MSEETMNAAHKKILVADDEQDLREALHAALSTEGFEVIAAENGTVALEKALSEHPDLILLDLMMPGLTGKEVLSNLRADSWGADAKVLVLTAVSDLESLSEILEEGGMDYLVKSDWELSEIVAKVKERLGV